MMSRFWSRSSRVSVGFRPIIAESVGSEPGPSPSIVRPRVRWSRSTMRSATHSGLWYATDVTPVPSRMCRGALRGGRDEDLRRGDDLAAGRVVLADPGLVVAEPVEVRDQLEVALERQGRVLAGRMERREEHPEAQPAHCLSPLVDGDGP